MTGATIGRYRCLAKLGEGGMGEVYVAHDAMLDRKVAVKVIVPADEANSASHKRLLREAKLAASLNHPFVCRVYEVGIQDGRPFVAMEFIEGRTLEARLHDSSLPFNEALQMFTEIAEAVQYAHDHNLIHRDLKPANIMIASDGHVRVLDFGIAKQLRTDSDATETSSSLFGQLVGTLKYMSPEQISGLWLDHRSDIFSLGVILFEMLTGVHPFSRNSPMATAMAILKDEPLPLHRFVTAPPAYLEAALARMLTKAVVHRFTSVREVLRALHEGEAVARSSDGILPGASLVVKHSVSGGYTIAVMPFVNMSRDLEQEFFSDGVTEDLIRKLSQLRGTKVLARTSMMRYKGSDKPIAEIGHELGVAYILEGSVRQSGSKLRVNAGLIEVATETYVWSEVYDRDITDILAIQSDVAARIAQALQMTLSGTDRFERDTSGKVESYQSFLKGMYLLNKLTPDAIDKGIRFFEEALRIDPTNARAYAGIAYANCMIGHFDYNPANQAFERAKIAALRAAEYNSRMSETHICMGLTQMFHDWDWAGAEHSFRKALQLNSNSADAHLYYSWCLAIMQEIPRAVLEARYALDLDPLSPTAQTNLAGWLVNQSLFDEAIGVLEKALDLNPQYVHAYTILGHAYVGVGNYERAMSYFDKFAWRMTLKAIGMAALGKDDEALAIVESELKSETHRLRPSEIALVLIMTGRRDEGEQWLTRALRERDYMLGFLMSCEWAPYRNDPLLIEHLKQMGIGRKSLFSGHSA
jgi:serine/threonine protein kinase/tetratricopeptide (TPR) repeat protein